MPIATSKQRAAAVDVGELAEQRRRRSRGEQIGGHDPGQVVDVAEALADRRQRRRDDGLFERGEEHRQHDAGDDGADGGVVERRGRRVVRAAAAAADTGSDGASRRAGARSSPTTSGAMLWASSGAIWRVIDSHPLGPRRARAYATAVFAGHDAQICLWELSRLPPWPPSAASAASSRCSLRGRSSGTFTSLARTRPRTETPAACTVSGSPDTSGCHQYRSLPSASST